MDWMFIIFSVGSFAYSLFIIKDYLYELRLENIKIEHLRSEKFDLEQKIEENNKEKEEIVTKTESAKVIVNDLQEVASDRKGRIKGFESEMAKRGKYRVQ